MTACRLWPRPSVEAIIQTRAEGAHVPPVCPWHVGSGRTGPEEAGAGGRSFPSLFSGFACKVATRLVSSRSAL